MRTAQINFDRSRAAGLAAAALVCMTTLGLPAAESVSRLEVRAPPGAPGAPLVTVFGNTVTLAWTPPPDGGPVAYYLIQAGSTAGAIDYGTYNVGLVTTVTAVVPAARYFVRVFAVNVDGAGPASRETEFTVGTMVPPSTALRCVAFGPYVAHYSPRTGPHPPPEVIDALVRHIATTTDFNCLMTYGVLNGLDYTFEAARRYGLKVIAIVWLDGVPDDNASIDRGILRAKEYTDTIVRVACGSELRVRHRGAVAAEIITACAIRLRAAGVTQPVGTNDTWWSLCDEQWPCRPWLALSTLDWVGANIFAWWENRFSGLFPCITAAEAPAFTVTRLQDVRSTYAGRETISTEFGWPAGPEGYRETNERTGAPGCGVASMANQRQVVTDTVHLLRQLNLPYVVFSAYREPWKIIEGPVGPWWGILELPR